MAPLEPLEMGHELKPTWRAPWYFFCGRCTPSDSISCCTAYWVPCVAYGWTTSRAFRTSFWKEVGKFCLVLTLVSVINMAFAIAAGATCPTAADTMTQPDIKPPPPTKACTVLSSIQMFVNFAAIGCAIAWAVHIGGPRRTKLRKLLGIPDSGAGGDCCTCCYSGADKGSASDCCLHFWCLWCALAQEMRTVMHLQAANKLPEGPPEGYEPLITTAPAVDRGMMRGKGDMLV